MRQVRNVASDVFVQDAWARGQDARVHGWVYSLANGLVNAPQRHGQQTLVAANPRTRACGRIGLPPAASRSWRRRRRLRDEGAALGVLS